jgi:tetratricopeptide (TPR) repeat protein
VVEGSPAGNDGSSGARRRRTTEDADVPKLYIVEGGNESVYEIFDNEVGLGRGAANAVQIADSHASKMHAVVRELRGHWKLIDLESRNGTRVNAEFRNQHWLADGDTVSIGSAILRYAAEGSPSGAPAAEPPAAQPARPAVAKPAMPARPVQPAEVARPAVPAAPVAPVAPAVPATPAPAVPATPAPAAPVVATPAPAAPAPARRSPAPARRRRPERDDYDDYDDYDDRPARRTRSNSGPIVIIGVLAAAAFLAVMFVMMSGGVSVNQDVYRKAEAMADKGEYEKALAYAEQNADPDGDDYKRVLNAMDKWKELVRSKKDLERNEAARKYYNYEIYRQQAITNSFKAKDALDDEDVVRRLRQVLTEYPGTQVAYEIMHSEHSGFPELREAMREYADEKVTASHVLGALQAPVGLLVGDGRFGEAVQRLEYARDMNRLVMTPENYADLGPAIEARINEIVAKARDRFRDDKREVEGFRRNGQRGQAWRKLKKMTESYAGIPELMRLTKLLDEQR